MGSSRDNWLLKVSELLCADTANLKELATIAGEDPATFYIGIELADLDLDGQDLSGMEFSSADDPLNSSLQEFYSFLQKIPRREERVAVLFGELRSHDPEWRERALAAYPFDTVFELRAINGFNAYLPISNERDFDLILSIVASHLYQTLVTHDKAEFLLSLARWVGNAELIRSFIKAKLRSAQSPRIRLAANDISKTLADSTHRKAIP